MIKLIYCGWTCQFLRPQRIKVPWIPGMVFAIKVNYLCHSQKCPRIFVVCGDTLLLSRLHFTVVNDSRHLTCSVVLINVGSWSLVLVCKLQIGYFSVGTSSKILEMEIWRGQKLVWHHRQPCKIRSAHLGDSAI